ncbi:hypothetical protein JHK87_000640 [Glycine soja]|nr:hypothetical protein JHK87_000640 [Glycine soja]
MDEENYVYQYIIDEANLLLDTLEKVCYEYKLVASLDGGCIQHQEFQLKENVNFLSIKTLIVESNELDNNIVPTKGCDYVSDVFSERVMCLRDVQVDANSRWNMEKFFKRVAWGDMLEVVIAR